MVFLFYLIIILLVVLAFIFSKIRIEVINFKFTSSDENHINKEYKIILKLCILAKIPILKIDITKAKLEKKKVIKQLQKLNIDLFKDKNNIDKNFIKTLKTRNLQIEKINLNIEIGTENAMVTSLIVPAVSTIIAIYLRKKIKNYENQIFIINPIYQNRNLINIYISGIFDIKMIHIINILYKLNRKGKVKKYERTSNRRPYDYSYE